MTTYQSRMRSLLVEVVKASLDLTLKYPNINKERIGFLDDCNWKISYTSLIQRRAVGIAPLMPGRYNFKRLLKFIGLKKVKTNSLKQKLFMWPVVLSNSSVISTHRISGISDHIPVTTAGWVLGKWRFQCLRGQDSIKATVSGLFLTAYCFHPQWQLKRTQIPTALPSVHAFY